MKDEKVQAERAQFSLQVADHGVDDADTPVVGGELVQNVSVENKDWQYLAVKGEQRVVY
jgi:hypothetical protein